MAITIEGLRISHLSIDTKKDLNEQITGTYELYGPNGLAIVKQNFNGYADVKLNPSPVLVKAKNDFLAAIQIELNLLLGV